MAYALGVVTGAAVVWATLVLVAVLLTGSE